MKQIKTLVGVLMVLILMSSPVFGQTMTFEDMPNNWAKPGMTYAVENHLMQGYEGYLRPFSPLTRAELAQVVTNALKATERADLSLFSDVGPKDWYFDPLSKTVHLGYFKGYDQKLRPNEYITREETFVVLSRVFDLNPSESVSLLAFEDADSVSKWAWDAASAMVSRGYVLGTGSAIHPSANISRAEFATILSRIVPTIIHSPGLYSGNFEGNVLIVSKGVTFENAIINGDLYLGPNVLVTDVAFINSQRNGDMVVNGNREVLEVVLEDEDIALGAATGPQTPATTPTPEQAPVPTPPSTPDPAPTPVPRSYDVIVSASGRTALLTRIQLLETTFLSFDLLNGLYESNREVAASLIQSDYGSLIPRALMAKSENTQETYVFGIASRINHARSNGQSVFSQIPDALIEGIINSEERTASPQALNEIIALLLNVPLRTLLDDFASLYPNGESLPTRFEILVNGTVLPSIEIKNLESTLNGMLSTLRVSDVVGRELIAIRYNNQEIAIQVALSQ